METTTEAEIAADLAAKVNPVEPPAVEVSEEPKQPEVPEDEAFHDNLPLENTLEKIKLLDYFEIPQLARRSAEVDNQLSRIVDWAKDEAKSSEFTDILRILNDQERVLGTKLKDNRLTKLYQFVTINSQRKRLAEMERALYQ